MFLSTEKKPVLAAAAAYALAACLAGVPGTVEASVHHRAHKAVAAAVAPEKAPPRRQGVVGYFGPGAYGPFGVGPLGLFSPGYGYGYGYGPPRGDLGFALLGALNGGGLKGFVECGNYYASTPGACGF